MRTPAAVLTLLLALSLPPSATAVELGVYGATAFSSNSALGDPAGFGLYLNQGLSPKVSLRSTFTWLGSDGRYFGSFPVGFPPPDYTPVYETLDRESSARLFDVNLLHRLIGSDRLSLSAGAGLGLSHLKATVAGTSTTLRDSWSSNHLYYGLLVDIQVNRLVHALPINFRLCYHFRQLSGETPATDVYAPFASAFTLSTLQAGLSYHF